MSTLQIQSSRINRELHQSAGSCQPRSEAKVSNARKRPEAIKQRNPPYLAAAEDSDRANFRTAIAKNRPASVGKITFPAQFVRFRMPFVNDIAFPMPPSKAPISRFLKRTASPVRQQPDAWPAGG